MRENKNADEFISLSDQEAVLSAEKATFGLKTIGESVLGGMLILAGGLGVAGGYKSKFGKDADESSEMIKNAFVKYNENSSGGSKQDDEEQEE